ncbi:hydroxyethylthiazole kinase [Clostridium tetanomorphum]|uniref:Hydroxyethylthiazole kinase n=1 Tax=Clostridium tetanomorphum TaxID=1553 RepID=A0A923E8K2_CLOTT|nr:hydroxyethylthiazole kinase [Clostridium tetanomorphum]KAJ53466.1 hydroxyethylthiazole kinase [Clostridium tetanomorphum DSM 665]MBC2398460.1 hydroxyethylthiazole kinase [Clostridium tetanomorphum]MBP1865305.1 hydroxyethylthiazole kinase [Clostridium tetanomorphum]NRS85228.1 hydroxyethylthiazole kinase [Clostridium tetanomorphum]NRZ98405.1 hydroxyethylthiazole kinase [Clostridium tetanomorphum]
MEIYESINNSLLKVKEKNPLIHHITNYVTVNDCANIVLAIGGSPVMADDEREVEEMVSIASSLVINIGTLNSRTVKSMLLAGKRANKLNIPVILDPVGVGATSYRTEVAKELIEEVHFSVIRGNLSEIKNIAGIKVVTKGVDTSEVGDNCLKMEEKKEISQQLSKKLDSVIAITGEVDCVSFENKSYYIANGHKILSKVTGTGCMCSSLIGSFCGGESNYLIAATAGIASMGIAGELAWEKTKELGTGSFKSALMDNIYTLNYEAYKERGKIYYGEL